MERSAGSGDAPNVWAMMDVWVIMAVHRALYRESTHAIVHL